MKNQKGFSLIELLIVVVIIGIVASIALPYLLAARSSANEGSAISALRTLHGAQMTYQTTVGAGKFAGDASNSSTALSTLSGANLIDSNLGGGTKSGYIFVGGKVDATTGATATPAQFWISSIPTVANGNLRTGPSRLGLTSSGVIKRDMTSISTHFSSITEIDSAPALSN